MGIILEKSKLIFDELIGANSFDEIFKNSIRDYYTYGFKSYDQFSKGIQTINDRWKILSKILGEKWYLEKRRNGRNQIILKSMPVDTKNPIDDFYFLHNLSKIGDYLNYLLDLDIRSSLRDGITALPVTIDELLSVQGSKGVQDLVDVDEIEYAIMDNWIHHLNDLQKTALPIRINRQLNVWSPGTRFMPKSYKDKYDNLSTRTEYLSALGILGDLRDDSLKRNKWLTEQWEEYNPSFKRYFNNKSSGNHYWYKSPLTLSLLFSKQKDTATKSDFINRFQAMCEFFSQYYPLGEIGTILAKRCRTKTVQNQRSRIFRFKHNYLQKTLYDYNLLDLMTAIEQNYLCLIRYAHGTNLQSYEELAIPLEIRISVSNGREYVLYYHILERRIKALRLEFIDKITLYKKASTIKKVERVTYKDGKKKITEERYIQDVVLNQSDLNKQICIAQEMLPHIWGTGVNHCTVDENWRERLISFKLPVEYDLSKESYIAARMRKESRTETPEQGITIFPTTELRKWIRSYYLRIHDSEDLHKTEFNITEDIHTMWEIYFAGHDLPGQEYNNLRSSDTTFSENGYIITGEVVPDSEVHGALFNELFSWYSIALADSVLDERTDKRKVLKEKLGIVLGYYTADELDMLVDKLYAYLLDSELINSDGETRFRINNTDYLSDLLPLTKVEVRWLMTVLEDPLAAIFLSEEQIHILKTTCKTAPFQAKKLHMDAINYFDRFQQERKMTSSEKDRMNKRCLNILKILYSAIESENKVRIIYRNWKGEKRYVTCSPAWLEYSRRDNLFRVWYLHSQKSQIRMINIPRIITVEILPDKNSNLIQQQLLIKESMDQTMTHIQIEFYQGTRNLPDRMLTEFSLWKKKCVYDVETGKYTMTLYYSTIDKKEIMIRLLSYGPYIRIHATDDNYILSEIKKRIAKQKKLICEKEHQ